MPEKELLSSLCVSGEGKGRFEYRQNKHLFNYVSKLKPSKSIWIWGFDLPVIGQEVMKFNYKTKNVTGTFANRLRSGANSVHSRDMLDKFFKLVSDFGDTLEKGKLGQEWSYKSRLVDGKHVLERGRLTVSAFALSEGFFKRTTYKYVDEDKNSLVLEVFSDTCTK
jgi:hypothetical protein